MKNLLKYLLKHFLNVNGVFFFAALPLIYISCSSNTIQGKTEAEAIYKEAVELTAKERYLLAIEKINLLKSQYPYSFYATHAELLQADILFMQENHIEAAAAYILFKDLHPKHEKLAHVVWRIAESFFLQLPSTFDRDLSPAQEAIKYYNELIKKFPKSEYISQANSRINEINKMVINKDFYIADFYFRTEVYDSARFRYMDILKNYEDEKSRDLSVERILESSIQLKEYDKCLSYGDEYKDLVSEKNKNKVERLIDECKKNQT